jgi:DNA primase
MRYPQTFVDDLKRQADIVRVVQDYVQLKKKGANWMACCPFHKEKTPSFSVSPTKEIFYCFGCHKGGDVFSFVKEIEGVGYGEAIKIVADRVGMPLPKMVDDDRFAVKRQELMKSFSSTTGHSTGGRSNSKPVPTLAQHATI